MQDVVFEHGRLALAEQWHDDICRLYEQVFSMPPFAWSEDGSIEHTQELSEVRNDPTFAVTIARDSERLIGFAYGHRLPVDHGWWQDFLEPLPPTMADEWDGRTFALINLAVDEDWRGQGIGKQVLSLLLERRLEERAILSVQPAAVETQRIYKHLGWRKVGTKGPIPEALTPYWNIFLRDLKR